MKLLGLDIGTSRCKAAVFSAEGALLSAAAREYAVEFPHPGWAEQDAENIWRLARQAMAEAARACGGDVAALGLSAQGEAVIPVDGEGNALRPAILGMDTRTDSQNEWLRKRFGAEPLFRRTGMPVHTINTLPKLLWLREQEPALWSKARQFLLYEDFLIRKMTGAAAISRCLASRTQLYDLAADGWSEEILAAADLTPDRLAPVTPSGMPAGRMEAELARRLGFSAPPLVVAGGHDQACAALGVGLVRPGQAMVSTGTAEVVEVVLASPALNRTLYEGNISCYAHVVPGMYLAMTLNHSGGLLLRWLRDTLCREETARARAAGRDPYDVILDGLTADEPSPLLVLPHFAGSGTPTFDTSSKGAILGLSFASRTSDIAKAVVEGLTFELRLNLDLLRRGGVAVDELRAVGGGARSPLWLQLKATITGIPVAVPKVVEAACWGAALLAGQGAGAFRSASEVAEERVKILHRLQPDAAARPLYDQRYAVYEQVYPALAAINRGLSATSAGR